MTLATVGSDEDLRRQLVNSRVVTEEAIRSAEVGGRSLSESSTASGLSDFFREEVIESLYRIRKPGRGQFAFNTDIAPRYRSEQSFDVEMCISETDRRSVEWADIESVVPSIDESLRVVTDAPNNEPVTLAPSTWKLVANFEGSSSVRSLSDRLGSGHFRTAKDVAAMVRSGLVESARTAEPAHQAPGFSYAGYQTTAPEPTEYEGAPSVTEEIYEPEPVEADFNRSWWAEAVPKEEPIAELPAEPVAEAEGAEQDEQDEPSEEQEAEGVSESFLDRVFSQLNENAEGQGGTSPVATHGFLKRRRMSSVGLDE